MNTLQDLRASLDQHAGDIPADATTQARVSAVRARAVRLRRRQSGSVVAVAAAVAAVVAVSTWLPNGAPQPAEQDRTLLGREAPAEMSALGYTYAFEEGVESRDGVSSIELERSDEPRLLTWAAEGRTVKLVGPGRERRVSDGVEFDDWLVVPPGAEGVYTVRENETALAVYELTGDRPAGVTVDGITFRQEVAGARLLDAEVGEDGDGEVTLSFEAPPGPVQLSSFCTGSAPDVWVHVGYVGERGGSSSGSGCGDSSFDPGGNGGTISRTPGRAGDEVTVRIHLTEGANGPRIAPDGVRLGLGAYSVPEPVATVVSRYDAPELRDFDGHRWVFQRAVRSEGEGELVLAHPGGGPLFVEGFFAGAGRSGVVFDDGSPGRRSFRTGSGGGVLGVLSGSDQRVRLAVGGSVPAGLQLGFAIYERAD